MAETKTEQEKQDLKERAEMTAELIKMLEPSLALLDLEALKGALKELRELQGKDDAIGCLLKPDGYGERSDVNKAKQGYLEGLIKVRESLEGLRDAMINQRKNAGQTDELMRKMGLI
jgi:hypothetical protein